MISIIVPVYMVEQYLDKCIISILNQTYKDLQIILVDDGSSDQCGKICDLYREKDSRICVIHKPNGGLSDARNAGLDVAKGEYIGFVDSDDYIAPHMYEILLSNLLETNSDISVCSFQWLKEDEMPEIPGENNLYVFEGHSILQQLIENNLNTVVAWNKLYKKEVFNKERYEVGRIHEDEFIIHRLLIRTKRIVYTECKLYNYIKHKDSIVNNKTLKSLEDAWDAFEDRCVTLRGKDDTVYCWTNFQQLDMFRQCYYQLNGNQDAMKLKKKLYNEAKKKGRNKEIWNCVSPSLAKGMKVFLISPYLYCGYEKVINLVIKVKDILRIFTNL